MEECCCFQTLVASLNMSTVGGRHYVKVKDRPQGGRRPSSSSLPLLDGRPLLTLSSNGQLPVMGDIVRYVKGHQLKADQEGGGGGGGKLKNAEIICCPLIRNTRSASCLKHCLLDSSTRLCAVAAVKQDSWTKSGVPMKSDKSIAAQISKVHQAWQRLLTNLGTTSKKEEEFARAAKKVMDFSAQDAKTQILKDRLRSEQAKQEDLAFLVTGTDICQKNFHFLVPNLSIFSII